MQAPSRSSAASRFAPCSLSSALLALARSGPDRSRLAAYQPRCSSAPPRRRSAMSEAGFTGLTRRRERRRGRGGQDEDQGRRRGRDENGDEDRTKVKKRRTSRATREAVAAMPTSSRPSAGRSRSLLLPRARCGRLLGPGWRLAQCDLEAPMLHARWMEARPGGELSEAGHGAQRVPCPADRPASATWRAATDALCRSASPAGDGPRGR